MYDFYSRRVWDKNVLPSIYMDSIFADAILQALKIGELKSGFVLWDLMSGAGLSLQLVTEARQDFTACIIDRSKDLLEKTQELFKTQGTLAPAELVTVQREIREGLEGILPLPDVILARYAMKDLGEEFLIKVIKDCASKLNQDGRLVIADMTAQNISEANMITRIHRKKQELSGRDIRPVAQGGDGECFIPDLEGWVARLKEAGFRKIKISLQSTSIVETQQWVNSKQLSQDQIIEMNEYILAQVPSEISENYGIKILEKDTQDKPVNLGINFPIFVAYAEK